MKKQLSQSISHSQNGTYAYLGDRQPEKTQITLTSYSQTAIQRDLPLTRLADFTRKNMKCNDKFWLNVSGFADVAAITDLTSQIELHPLVIEDIFNMNQRPKVEFFEKYVFIVLHIQMDIKQTQQVSFILFENMLVCFQELAAPGFQLIEQRLDTPNSKLTSLGSDYLFYFCLDILVDSQFLIVEALGDDIEALEEHIISKERNLPLPQFYRQKRRLMKLRKQLQPLRDGFSSLLKSDGLFIKESTLIYLRDVHDHTLRLNDMLESQREMLMTLLEVYLSGVNNKMNQTMKVLTMFSAVFIPLGFIASLYGMNFVNMPELKWHYGYYFTLGIMASVAVGLMAWFRIKKWW